MNEIALLVALFVGAVFGVFLFILIILGEEARNENPVKRKGK